MQSTMGGEIIINPVAAKTFVSRILLPTATVKKFQHMTSRSPWCRNDHLPKENIEQAERGAIQHMSQVGCETLKRKFRIITPQPTLELKRERQARRSGGILL